MIADPDKRLYADFGVEARLRALLDPRAWWPILRGVTASIWRVLRGQAPLRVPSVAGGNLGLPADFLIAKDGHILASKYGTHAYDQWSVDAILENVAVDSNGFLNAARSKLTAAATAGRTAWRS